MMNPEIKEKWVTALRGGEYKQGTGVLHRDGEFCCLGVLCDLAVNDGVRLSVTSDEDGVVFYDDEHGTLPLSVREWADLHASDPYVRLDDETHEFLTALNDDTGLTFPELADLIEARL